MFEGIGFLPPHPRHLCSRKVTGSCIVYAYLPEYQH